MTPDQGIPVLPPADLAGAIGTPEDALNPDQATVQQAWWKFMQRIGKHNPALIQEGARALDAVENIMRTH